MGFLVDRFHRNPQKTIGHIQETTAFISPFTLPFLAPSTPPAHRSPSAARGSKQSGTDSGEYPYVIRAVMTPGRGWDTLHAREPRHGPPCAS